MAKKVIKAKTTSGKKSYGKGKTKKVTRRAKKA
jgi:hypothetical protein